MDLCEFKASLVYIIAFQDSQSYTEKPFLEKPKQHKEASTTMAISHLVLSIFGVSSFNPQSSPLSRVRGKGSAFYRERHRATDPHKHGHRD